MFTRLILKQIAALIKQILYSLIGKSPASSVILPGTNVIQLSQYFDLA